MTVRSTATLVRADPARSCGATVVRLPRVASSDDELVRGVQNGDRRAAAELLDRHGPVVERIIRRVLGDDPELEDLVQEAFATVLASIHQVRDGEAVKGWVASIAAHTAHRAIRRRKAARWLRFWLPAEEQVAPASAEPHDAVRRAYAVLERMSADDRVAFALRYFEQMELSEVAATCAVSLATIKRRLGRAEKRFVAMATRDPVLRAWMEEGERWSSP